MMDEYICKNTVWKKPLTVRLYDSHFEIETTETCYVPYDAIRSITLTRNGKTFKTNIDTPIGDIILSNRYYLAGREFEDRSRKYNLFIQLLHLRLFKKPNVIFFTSRGWLHSLFGSKKQYQPDRIPADFLPL
ncbi:MAG: hypothetical protein JST43_06300 [Bacteroidetes bacterium]|nr:hypothetical protein [Bacteroidota bacterium]MBS1539406.1 hypothetical protein [Bacteroidota bacterium]